MSVISGKDVILYFLDNGVLKPLACSRSCELVTETDISETSTRGTGVWKTFRGLRNSWTVSTSGLVSFDTNFAVTSLRQYQFAFTPIFISLVATDVNGLVENYQGYVIVKTVSTLADYSGHYEYSVELVGNGELVITDTPIDPNEENDCRTMYELYDGTGTETGGNILPALPVLAGKEVNILFRDGIEYRKVVADPTGKQFQLDDEDDTIIIFAADIPPIEPGEQIDIPYQNAP